MSAFKDHFSANAGGYAIHRPHYPAELFAWLAEHCPRHDAAWDCATGNGQAAQGLAEHFRRVIATDASAEQIAQARPNAGVEYRVAPAEASGLDAASVDLVTVAQAAHWFDLPAFYAEARRVLRPGGAIALWGYERLELEPEVSRVVGHFYHRDLAGFWPPERHHVETAYRELPFPFAEESPGCFAMSARWHLYDLLGYLSTWSAVKNYRQARGQDPIPALGERLAGVWGSPDTRKDIKWPIFLRLGRV
jgi:SAM-dependent methyltransferase